MCSPSPPQWPTDPLAQLRCSGWIRHQLARLWSESWGIQRELWDRSWANLSGGEAQRIVLAIAVSLDTAEVLLLDEPTSALDSETSLKVEKHLVAEVKSPDSKLKAIVWITHSPEQGERVGTRFIRITSGGVREENVDPGV
ncbi:hypothetical protein NUW54_g12286 [Trametes sanguinea]|uniref:Uncharacterized protein n=1 Tax=Trametes sanguinea TaxID=158606 RepID=A0ACC1MZD3_9APHY|nr:hypothetical protein NUW54_g12286 [Trametes sanguinea]